MMHNQVYRGKRVLVIMKNGNQFVDHYVDTHNKKIEFKELGRVEKINIRSMTIFRARSSNVGTLVFSENNVGSSPTRATK